MSIIKLENISKDYLLKERKIHVLNNLSVTFELGKFYAIMGHSGCGKSTLISIIGLLEKIDSGSLLINNTDISLLGENDKADLRRKEIGFVFQDYYLDEYLKAYENVMLPLIINENIDRNKCQKLALSLLNKVGLYDRSEHYPKELSGGEKQRVAIARALSNDPSIILADEPTGNLDEESEKYIFDLLKTMSESGKCVIVVSHTNEVKTYADRVYYLEDGNLTKENYHEVK